MNNTKPQIHNSDLERMAMCGILWQRTKGYKFGCAEKKEIALPSPALAIGSAVHASVQVNLLNKIDNKELVPRESIPDTARDSFQGIWDGGMLLSEDEATDQQGTLGGSIDMSIALSLLHYDELAPELNPVAVEKKWVLEMPEEFPFDLAGQIDIVERSGIRDTKTRKASPPKGTARSLQMGMYSLAHKKHTGKLPEKVSIDCLVKTKTPKVVVDTAIPTMDWIDPVFRRIEQAWRTIEAVKAGYDCFQPADPTHWICSKRYCPFAITCKFWSGKE